MQINTASLMLAATFVALGGCAKTESARSDSTMPSASNSVVATIDTAPTVTTAGYGPLLIGMTVANAAAALHSPTPPTAGLDTSCAYIKLGGVPAGLRIMVTHGTVARIEIDSASIRTGLGVVVGDPESRVRDLYGSRLTVQPHKYDPNGRYLIVHSSAPSDSTHEIVFETNGDVVTKYRAGRVPEVEWVEGCG
jgi:hypothetical protein